MTVFNPDTQFSHALPATYSKEYVTTLASIPDDCLDAVLASYAKSHHAGTWLRTFMEMGGFHFPMESAENGFLQSHTPKGDEGHITHSAFKRQSTVANLMNRSGLYQPKGASVYMAVIEASDDVRAFHADFCQHLVENDLHWKQRSTYHALKPAYRKSIDDALVETFAVALATACMLDAPHSVKLIAQHCPEAMTVTLSSDVMGPVAMQCLPDNGNPIKVTPYLCALQFSSTASMAALQACGFDPDGVLGTSLLKRKNKVDAHPGFTLLKMEDYCLPLCSPEVYEQVWRKRLHTATKSERKKCSEDAVVLLSYPRYAKEQLLGYVNEKVSAGVFDSEPTQAVLAGCRYGYVSVVKGLSDKYVAWENVAQEVKVQNSPVFCAAREALTTSGDRSWYDQSMAAMLQGLINAGLTEAAISQTSNFDRNAGKDVMQPIHAIIAGECTSTLRVLLDNGLNPTAKNNGLDSPLEIARGQDNACTEILVSFAARQRAMLALSEIEEHETQSAAASPEPRGWNKSLF